MMVGKLLSYWKGNFSGAMLNFGRVLLLELVLSYEQMTKNMTNFPTSHEQMKLLVWGLGISQLYIYIWTRNISMNHVNTTMYLEDGPLPVISRLRTPFIGVIILVTAINRGYSSIYR